MLICGKWAMDFGLWVLNSILLKKKKKESHCSWNIIWQYTCGAKNLRPVATHGHSTSVLLNVTLDRSDHRACTTHQLLEKKPQYLSTSSYCNGTVVFLKFKRGPSRSTYMRDPDRSRNAYARTRTRPADRSISATSVHRWDQLDRLIRSSRVVST